ncbi:MAG: beta-L-arabinofuranosidase domain-containing protein [Candidatus Sulfotelmatobacter sp.]
MTDCKSRRDFVKVLAASSLAPLASKMALGTGKGGTGNLPTTDLGARSRLQPFNYEGVRLSTGMLDSQFRATRAYYFSIPNDDILKGFRQRAGLRAPGNDLGGWYSGDPTVTHWWSKGDTFNVFGQWLSGMARLSKAGNDEELSEKAVHLMIEWGKTIEDDGFFFYSRRPNAPHYTYDKTVCGLIDLYEYCGRTDALPLLEKITDWAIPSLDRIRKLNLSDPTEWYTLSENLYRAYRLTGNAKYKNFGDVWQYPVYWKFFTGGTEVAPYHYHAYSHVNTLSSAAMAYEVTGEEHYLKTIVNAYDWLERTQLYATGGYGPEEEMMPPDGSLSNSLETTFRSFETPCGSWAGFKLSRYLMQFTGEARYGDWIEKLVYNGIGAALPMAAQGQTFYYSDYRMGGGRKIYHIDGTWPCCSGTYPQVVADYHNVIYFKDQDGLYINLFVPSVVTWHYKQNEIAVEQETTYPESDSTVLTVTPRDPATFNLKFRVPGWAEGATVRVNGVLQTVATRPGTWAEIRRTWKAGDRVAIQIGMRLRTVPVDAQHPQRVALVYGPVVLVQKLESVLPVSTGEILARRPRGNGLTFSAHGQPVGDFVPFYKVGAGVPYNMYFDLLG